MNPVLCVLTPDSHPPPPSWSMGYGYGLDMLHHSRPYGYGEGRGPSAWAVTPCSLAASPGDGAPVLCEDQAKSNAPRPQGRGCSALRSLAARFLPTFTQRTIPRSPFPGKEPPRMTYVRNPITVQIDRTTLGESYQNALAANDGPHPPMNRRFTPWPQGSGRDLFLVEKRRPGPGLGPATREDRRKESDLDYILKRVPVAPGAPTDG